MRGAPIRGEFAATALSAQTPLIVFLTEKHNAPLCFFPRWLIFRSTVLDFLLWFCFSSAAVYFSFYSLGLCVVLFLFFVAVSFNSVPLMPRRHILCPERQRMQSALWSVKAVRSGGKFFRLFVCLSSTAFVFSKGIRKSPSTLRKNLHYYSSIYHGSSRTTLIKISLYK